MSEQSVGKTPINLDTASVIETDEREYLDFIEGEDLEVLESVDQLKSWYEHINAVVARQLQMEMISYDVYKSRLEQTHASFMSYLKQIMTRNGGK